MAGKPWGRSREEEDEYRRKLLLLARKGNVEAEHELMTKYGMRVYSDTERSDMPTYYDSGKKGSPPSLTNASRASFQANSAASQGKAKSTATPKRRSKATGRGNKNIRWVHNAYIEEHQVWPAASRQRYPGQVRYP